MKYLVKHLSFNKFNNKTMENDFLPQGYEAPASGSKYMKFEEGDNKFRVLSSAIVGWLDWSADRKPIRTKTQPEILVDPNKPAKHFWAFVVWDYKKQAINILEVTQVGIRNSIIALVENSDWGDPKEYDITVKREGKELDTKYTVTPSPHKPLDENIKNEYSEMTINLKKLYSNGDPFEESIDVNNIPM